ncbi:hypothetical protein BX616_011162 [Lobosporangium transversale]|uniref:tRNA/rRNA methyltransferase SpoU type domain-containing protein n=1 Tax=Lobosporangium transversale TaxID=64571 RepID=A0A1Y2G7Q8_9FUNG|nr:hypothetical protein BCR41DRAFT_363481 [Lobosporangium transversale]KAF9909463.1 hypothetical protein BX616_011162 [Lobosporangium transversale]ORZ01845.1 hypothetical protein BCR41DRAFT_363481 [Lobosporangium transversale]|eukprot:XP_021876142.1 hypothetical protein BCR41DRAFT_363481 [Lobosporangium transversale]
MSTLPSRFLRITASNNHLVKRLERIRTSKAARQEEGHVVIQGIKTLDELVSKGHHRIRTIGVTFDEHKLPIRSPALDVITKVRQQEQEQQRQHYQPQLDVEDGQGEKDEMKRKALQEEHKGKQFLHVPRRYYEADQFVAVPPKLTTRILGTDSVTSAHEVWAEVAIPNHDHFFLNVSKKGMKVKERAQVKATERRKVSDIRRLLVLDQISDPGNMGLIIRSAKALSWDAAWHTPGTVDQYNNKVVRASRALCLDWPTKTGSWRELEIFLEANPDLTLLVADMMPKWILNLKEAHGLATADNTDHSVSCLNPYELVWWNWPKSLSKTHLPEKIALIMSSEHHGVKAIAKFYTSSNESQHQDDQGAKSRLLEKAIRVSIPMNPAVESMNVAAAATAMMWELNRVLSQKTIRQSSQLPKRLQIFDERAS